MSAHGPTRKLAVAQQYFGCPGVSGPTANMAGMVAPDPKQPLAVRQHESSGPWNTIAELDRLSRAFNTRFPMKIVVSALLAIVGLFAVLPTARAAPCLIVTVTGSGG